MRYRKDLFAGLLLLFANISEEKYSGIIVRLNSKKYFLFY